MKKIFVLLLVFVILLLGCPPIINNGGGEKTEEEVGGEAKIPDTTKVVTDALEGLASDKIYFSEDVDLEVGDVIVSGICDFAPNGFIRKVTSSYGGVAWTNNATLEDGIEECDVVSNVVLSSRNVLSVRTLDGVSSRALSLGSFYLDLDEAVLCSSSVGKVVADGSISFDLNADVSLKMKMFKIREFVAEAVLTGDVDVDISGDIEASFDKSVKIENYTFAPYTIFIPSAPPFPIVLVFKLSLYLNYYGEISARLDAGVSQSMEATFGYKYTGSNWEKINDFDKSFNFDTPSLDANANIVVGPSVEFEVLLYGVAGLYTSLLGYLELDADISTNPWLSLYGGIKLDAGFSCDMLGDGIPDIGGTLFDYKKLLYSNSNAPEEEEPEEPNNPSYRFTDMDNGTVKDNETGLIWTKNIAIFDERMTWEFAEIYAAYLSDGEFGLSDGSSDGDWRLPTVSEWMSVIDTDYYGPALCDMSGENAWSQGNAFLNPLQINEGYYTWFWSSDEIDSENVYVINLCDGEVDAEYKARTWRAWPVRDARSDE